MRKGEGGTGRRKEGKERGRERQRGERRIGEGKESQGEVKSGRESQRESERVREGRGVAIGEGFGVRCACPHFAACPLENDAPLGAPCELRFLPTKVFTVLSPVHHLHKREVKSKVHVFGGLLYIRFIGIQDAAAHKRSRENTNTQKGIVEIKSRVTFDSNDFFFSFEIRVRSNNAFEQRWDLALG